MDKDSSNNHQDPNEEKDASKQHPKAAFEFALNAKTQGGGELESPAPPPPNPGDLLQYVGDYKIKSEISSGAMGVVFLAVQQSLKREVALKMIHPSLTRNKNLRQRFRIEAEAVASLDHPNIVPIYEVGEHNGQPYFTMRHLSGGNLAEAFADAHDLSSKERKEKIAVMVSTVALAVHHAHQRGILHRDLKPSNVLLDEHGIPTITDFGLAKISEKETTLTRTQSTLGTPAYMSPEQAGGRSREISVTSDVYSLGAILYELLTGRPPFTGDSHLEIMDKVRDEPPATLRSINPDVDTDLEIICLKALNKIPRMRYGSAKGLADDLNRWVNGEAIQARRVTPFERFQMWIFRHPGWAAALLFLLMITVGLPLLSWQINEARKAEKNEKEKTADMLVRSRLEDAEQLLANGASGQALAYLASILRLEPGNHAVAEKLIYLLTYRNWILPQSTMEFGEALPTSTEWSANGRFLTALMPDENTVRLWDIQQGKNEVIEHNLDGVKLVTISPDSSLLVLNNSTAGSVHTLPTGNLLASLPAADGLVQPFFNPKSTHLFLNRTNAIQVHDHSDLTRTPILLTPGWPIRDLEFHPGKPEVAILAHNRLSTWNYRTGQRLHEIQTSLRNITYWRSGEWLLSFNGDAPRSTQPVYRPLADSLLYDASNGDLMARCNKMEQWEYEDNMALPDPYTDLSRLPGWEQWAGFVQHRPFARPLKAFRFQQPTMGGRRIQNRERRPSGISTSTDRRNHFKHVPSGNIYFRETSSESIALDAYGHRLRVLDASTDRFQIWDTIQIKPILEPHMGAFDLSSPDGRHFIESGERATWVAWSATENGGQPDIPLTVFQPEKAVFAVGGTQIASIDTQGGFRLHDASDLSLISNPEKPFILQRFSQRGGITRLELLDGLDVIAVGTKNGSVQLWDGRTAEPLSQVIMLPGKLLDLNWLPQQNRLAIRFQYGSPSTAWIWDITSHSEMPLPTDNLGRALPCLAMDPTGTFLLLKSAPAEARLWNAPEARWHASAIKLPSEIPNNPKQASFSAGFSEDNRRYYIRTGSSFILRDLDDETFSEKFTVDLLSRVTPQKIEWMDQGNSLLIASSRAFVVIDLDHIKPRFAPVKTDPFHLIHASPDGRIIVTASSLLPSESKVTAWNANDGTMRGIPYTQAGALSEVQLNQKGDRVLLIGSEEMVLWDTVTQVVLFRIPLPNSAVPTSSRVRHIPATAVLSPDGESILLTHALPGSPMALYRVPRMNNTSPSDLDRLISLSEAVGQYQLWEDGSIRRVGPDAFFEIKNSAMQHPFWERWLTSSSADKKASPWSVQDHSDHSQKDMKSAILMNCLESIRRNPNHEMAWARLNQIIPESLIGFRNRAWLLEFGGDLLKSFDSLVRGERLPAGERLYHAKEIKRFESEGGQLSDIITVEVRANIDRYISDWLTDAFFGATLEKPSLETLVEIIQFMEEHLRYKADSKLVDLAIQELEMSQSPDQEALEMLKTIQERQAPNQVTQSQQNLENSTLPSQISIPADAIGEAFTYSVKLKLGVNIVANQLVIGQNSLNDLLPKVISGTSLFTWNGSGFDSKQYIAIPGVMEGWQPAGGKFPPGTALMLQAEYPVSITFSGKKLKAPLPRTIPPGLNLLANQLPVESDFEAIIGRPPLPGEKMFPKLPLGSSEEEYAEHIYTEDGWVPEELILPVGEGAFFELIKASPLPAEEAK